MDTLESPEKDEICQSLIQFAECRMWTTLPPKQNYLDEFANNGRTVDFQDIEHVSKARSTDTTSPSSEAFNLFITADAFNLETYSPVSMPSTTLCSPPSRTSTISLPHELSPTATDPYYQTSLTSYSPDQLIYTTAYPPTMSSTTLSSTSTTRYTPQQLSPNPDLFDSTSYCTPRKLTDFSPLTLEDRADFLAKLKFLLPNSTLNQIDIKQQFNGQYKKKFKHQQPVQKLECVFCKNNNESKHLIRNHAAKDSAGRVTCPKLRELLCPICGATGDTAHTIKYCPRKPIITMEDVEIVDQIRKMHGFRSQDIYKMPLGAN